MEKDYKAVFDKIHASDRLRQEVWNMAKEERCIKKRRRLPKAALVAAVLVFILCGTGIAAVIMPDTLQGWFGQQWEEDNKEFMSLEQTQQIETLTQAVGVSDTCSGVTVTLDSLTRGDSCLWMLVKVDAGPDQREQLHHVDSIEILGAEEVDSVQTPGGYGFEFPAVWTAEDGTAALLLRYTVALTGEDSLFNGFQGTLFLENLVYRHSAVLEGTWELPFVLEPMERQALELESAVVPASNHETGEQGLTVELRDIQVTATGVRFIQDGRDQYLYPRLEGLVLADGTEVGQTGGSSRWVDAACEEVWASDYYWKLPVDISKVTALRFEDTLVPLG